MSKLSGDYLKDVKDGLKAIQDADLTVGGNVKADEMSALMLVSITMILVDIADSLRIISGRDKAE